MPASGVDWPADLQGGEAPTNYSHPQDFPHGAGTSHYQPGGIQDLGASAAPAANAATHHADLSSQSQWHTLGSHHETASQPQNQDTLSSADAPRRQHAEQHPYPHSEANAAPAFYDPHAYNIPVGGDYDYSSFAPQTSAQDHDYLPQSHGQRQLQANDLLPAPPQQHLNEPIQTPVHIPASYHPVGSLDSAAQSSQNSSGDSVLPSSIQQQQQPGSNYTHSSVHSASTTMPPPGQPPYVQPAPSQVQRNMVPQQIAGPVQKEQAEPKAASSGKKRRRSADEGEEDEEAEPKDRKRGRPRLTTKDETAIERRRTQIRLAQRAYRNRKDNAITVLEQKVKDLEKSQTDMSKEFSSFFDMVNSQSGALNRDSELARRFRELNNRFFSSGRGQLDANSSGSSSIQDDIDPRFMPHPNMSESSYHEKTPAYDNGSSSYATYEVITKPTAENASWPSFAPSNPDSRLSGWNSVYAPIDLRNPLPAPSSYADQEATFGRRLQRFTLEQGIKLMAMPNPPVEIFTAVFGFCLTFETKEGIVKRLTDSLKTLREESLYYWEHPFHNLGGAGTHLVQDDTRDEYNLPIGNQGLQQIHRPSLQTGYSMGPWPPHLEQIREMRLDERMRILFPGFTGYFLDSDEVELYLRKRGITIPPRADYLTAEINPNKFAGTVHLPDEARAVKDTEYSMFKDRSTSASGGPPMDTTMPFLCPAIPAGSFQNGAAAGTIKVTLDINTLICELANRSVCLGRTPGTRPPDIDKAVRIAAGIRVH